MHHNNHCLLCGSSRFRLIHKRGQWTYLRCRRCGLVRLDPMPSPEELRQSYHTYLPDSENEVEKWEAMMRPVVVKSARIIEAESPPGRLLDIGSGYGFFLKEMKQRGWEVEGIEISETGRQYAKAKIGVNIHAGQLESLSLPRDSFDAVTLFYVIEHLSDPLSTMKEVNRILKPGGLALVRWPHSTPIVRLTGPLSKRFDLYHSPYHLYDFSPLTMTMLLEGAHFEAIKTLVGGYTLPDIRINRWCSIITGILAERICLMSRGRILIPGVSKTTIAQKIELTS